MQKCHPHETDVVAYALFHGQGWGFLQSTQGHRLIASATELCLLASTLPLFLITGTRINSWVINKCFIFTAWERHKRDDRARLMKQTTHLFTDLHVFKKQRVKTQARRKNSREFKEQDGERRGNTSASLPHSWWLFLILVLSWEETLVKCFSH